MLEVKTKIGEGGRILIPAFLRENLHLSVGDEVILKIKDGELCISTAMHALKVIQEKVRQHIPDNVSLVDMLLDMRRKEVEHE